MVRRLTGRRWRWLKEPTRRVAKRVCTSVSHGSDIPHHLPSFHTLLCTSSPLVSHQTSYLCFNSHSPTSAEMLCRSCIPKVPTPTRTRALATSAMRLAHTHALRHSSLLTHSRPSSYTIPQSHKAGSSSHIRDAFHTRASFSTTVQRRANEVPSENIQAMFNQQQKLLKLMQDKPELLDNINQFVQLLNDNGVLVFVSFRCLLDSPA